MTRSSILACALASGFFAFPSAAQEQEPAYAYATLAEGRFEQGDVGKVDPGALFQSGSIAKWACSLAAVRLADRGALDLDAPISRMLPDLELGEAGTATLRQVLQNRSGLRDGLMPAVQQDMEGTLAIASTGEAIRQFVAGEMAREAGGEFSYDLVNWIVAQAVLEQASGEPLAKVLDSLVLEPAGMGSSHVFERQLGPEGQTPAEAAMPMPDFLQCAGGLATRPADLVALLRFAYKGGLSPDALAEFTTIATADENYALGGRIETHGGRMWSWQTGSNGPYKSVAIYDPVSDSGYAAMTATGDWEPIQQARDAWIVALSRPSD